MHNKKNCVLGIITINTSFVNFFQFFLIRYINNALIKKNIVFQSSNEIIIRKSEKKNDKYNWKFKYLLYFMGRAVAESQKHMDQMTFSIRIIKANYFQHNIKFSQTMTWRKTHEKLFSRFVKDLRWSEENPKSLCDWTKKIFSQKNEKKHVKA